MPLETIQPDAVGPIDQWSLGAGSAKVAASKLPDDDDTSYISETGNGQIQEFECNDAGDILFADTITQVNLKYRAKRVGISVSIIPGLRVGGGTLAEGAVQVLTNAYVDYNDSFAENPDAGPWLLADINTLRLRVRYVLGAPAEGRVTTLVAEVTYTRASDKSQHTMMLGVG